MPESDVQKLLAMIDTDIAALWAKTSADPFWMEFGEKQAALLKAEETTYAVEDGR